GYAPAFEYPESAVPAGRGFPWKLAAACLAVAAAAGLWWRPSSKPAFRVAGVRLVSSFPGSHNDAAFSPDGATIAFVAKTGGGAAQVWVKNLSQGDPIRITEGDTDAARPRWSPKTDQIVFARKGQGIWTVPPLGGPTRRIIERGGNPDFSPDGSQLVFENNH